MSQQLATVFGGSGGMGQYVVRELIKEGYRVRVVARGKEKIRKRLHDVEVDVRMGDAADSSFARRACEGSSLVFHSIGFPYPEWEEKQIPVMQSLLKGASGEGRRFVLVHPVYAYGHPVTNLVSEEHPTRPKTKKGNIRLKMEQMLQEAHDRGDVEGVIARFPDFYGPHVCNSYLDYILSTALTKNKVHWVGPLETKREYIYVPDGAKALIKLALSGQAGGGAWNIGGREYAGTEILKAIGKVLDKDLSGRSVPRWGLRLMGWIFLLDSAKYQKQFGSIPVTPLDEGIRETLRAKQEMEAVHAGNK
ncbi:NAD-dependent epimerase/dehydratase family protein [Desmospora profundinema]|uniref:Nucleoside-diphosphate-sugar epimerase n=1 Tax=Desmospora profundinema TaxID=1571184 RepID=A0ABU1II98_9BACL|nr:NAD-dependent epimerase/dehydratase family protein [Desmospora profundinema]MDR6224502.1 nucleoside-diphosphate-sugar epimerase [Desmospora profundinema]